VRNRSERVDSIGAAKLAIVSGNLAGSERLFLRAPEQREIEPSGEGDDRQIRWLAAFDDCLNDPR
jgi:hypothetical protein